MTADSGPDAAADRAPAPSLRALWSGRTGLLTAGLISIMTLTAFEAVSVATAMPAVASGLGILGDYTWAFTSYTVASLLAMVGAGLWSDAAGPRGPIIAGTLLFAGGSIIAGLAQGLPELIAGRALEGVGGGALIVAVYVIIARGYEEALRPKAFSMLAAAWVTPSLVGPLIAGWLTQAFSWRLIFLLVPVLVIPPFLVLVPRLHEYQGGTPQRGWRERLGAGVLATVALFALQDGALRLSWWGVVEMAVALVALAYALRHLLPTRALRMARGLPATVVMRGLAAAAYFSAEVFVPLALVQIRGVSITYAGVVLSFSAVCWMLGSYAQSRLAAHHDRIPAVRIGFALVVLCIATLPIALQSWAPPWIASISWGIGALGMGLAVPSVSVQVFRLSPDEDHGRNSAALQIMDAVSVSAVVAILGMGYAAAARGTGATAGTFIALWLASAAIGLVGLLVAGRMRPRDAAA